MLEPPRGTVWTVGHSTRTWAEFLDLLQENRIGLLADVRHYPSSSRVPWANRATLEGDLEAVGIRYAHLVDLGGYREPVPGSENTGWRNAGFRGYADHMQTEAFRNALDRAIALAAEARTAFMCAEAVPWRCHRGLLADALTVRGIRVVHILAPGRTEDHALTRFAKVHGDGITYPAAHGKPYIRRNP